MNVSTPMRALVLLSTLYLIAIGLAPLASASDATDQANATAASVNAGLSTVQIILVSIFGSVITILVLLALWKLIMGIVHRVGEGMGGASKD